MICAFAALLCQHTQILYPGRVLGGLMKQLVKSRKRRRDKKRKIKNQRGRSWRVRCNGQPRGATLDINHRQVDVSSGAKYQKRSQPPQAFLNLNLSIYPPRHLSSQNLIYFYSFLFFFVE